LVAKVAEIVLAFTFVVDMNRENNEAVTFIEPVFGLAQ
jgi:hypothetical protein